MTARQKEINKIKNQIKKLEERLEYLSKLPDSTIEDEFLCSFNDFPQNHKIWVAIFFETEARLKSEKTDHFSYSYYSIARKNLNTPSFKDHLTVKDLICCNEEKLASHRGVGKIKMEELKRWMEKHNLYFIG